MPDSFKKTMFALLLAVGLLSSLGAWAWPPTYGAEFELGTKGLAITGVNFDEDHPPSKSAEKQEQMEFVEHMRKRCVSLGCTVVEVQGKWDHDYRVEYPDGWWFKISYDPACVEITFKPSTLETLRAKAALINDHIFKTAHELDMESPTYKMNHFNMGIRAAFDDSGMDFLKFYVDYANHPDLALGSLGHDIYNAPPLSILGADQREALQNIIEEAQKGKLEGIDQIAHAIQERVYTRSYHEPWGGEDHYQAFGLKYVNRTNLRAKDAPFELRAVWGQKDAETFIKIAELMEARIQFLKNSKQPLIYAASTRDKFDPTELKTRFFIYIEEAGLKFQDYEMLLRPAVSNSPLSPLVDEKASLNERLKAVSDYWDLMLTSPYARRTVVELLSLPEAKGHPLADEIKNRLQKELNERSPQVTGLRAFWFAPKETAPVQILKSFWDEVKNAGAALSCRQVFTH